MKFLGGNASRAEVYGLFVAAVVLLGGGIGGAIALTNDGRAPGPVSLEAADTTVLGPDASNSTTTIPSSPESTSTVLSIPGLTASQAESLRRLFEEQAAADAERIRRENEEALRLAYAAAHPVGRIAYAEIFDRSLCGTSKTEVYWEYLGADPQSADVITIEVNGFVMRGSPNRMSILPGNLRSFSYGAIEDPSPTRVIKISTSGPEGPVSATLTPTLRPDCP